MGRLARPDLTGNWPPQRHGLCPTLSVLPDGCPDATDLGKQVGQIGVHTCRDVGRGGNRAPEIVRYAGEIGVDLIVLKSHRIDLENPSAGWGTVSYKVGILAQCPVLLVK